VRDARKVGFTPPGFSTVLPVEPMAHAWATGREKPKPPCIFPLGAPGRSAVTRMGKSRLLGEPCAQFGDAGMLRMNLDRKVDGVNPGPVLAQLGCNTCPRGYASIRLDHGVRAAKRPGAHVGRRQVW